MAIWGRPQIVRDPETSRLCGNCAFTGLGTRSYNRLQEGLEIEQGGHRIHDAQDHRKSLLAWWPFEKVDFPIKSPQTNFAHHICFSPGWCGELSTVTRAYTKRLAFLETELHDKGSTLPQDWPDEAGCLAGLDDSCLFGMFPFLVRARNQ